MTQPDSHFSVAVRQSFRCATTDAFEHLVDDLSSAWFADGTATFDSRATSFTFLCDVSAVDHRDAIQRVLGAVDAATRDVPERPGVVQQGPWHITATRHHRTTDTASENPRP
jgi:hypothetical protein